MMKFCPKARSHCSSSVMLLLLRFLRILTTLVGSSIAVLQPKVSQTFASVSLWSQVKSSPLCVFTPKIDYQKLTLFILCNSFRENNMHLCSSRYCHLLHPLTSLWFTNYVYACSLETTCYHLEVAASRINWRPLTLLNLSLSLSLSLSLARSLARSLALCKFLEGNQRNRKPHSPSYITKFIYTSHMHETNTFVTARNAYCSTELIRSRKLFSGNLTLHYTCSRWHCYSSKFLSKLTVYVTSIVPWSSW